MYKIIFYETADGKSEVWNFLEHLRIHSVSSKDSRIQYRQIIFCIELLQSKGTYLPENIVKHLEDDIWELRPGHNRIFFFSHPDDTFILLHHFRKKTQKTPRREILRAKAEQQNYLSRKESES